MGFRHVKFISATKFFLPLPVHGVWATFALKNHHELCWFSCKTQSFWVKLGSQFFQNIRPYSIMTFRGCPKSFVITMACMTCPCDFLFHMNTLPTVVKFGVVG